MYVDLITSSKISLLFDILMRTILHGVCLKYTAQILIDKLIHFQSCQLDENRKTNRILLLLS
jgi:trans-2-enoyl-CoA reductase